MDMRGIIEFLPEHRVQEVVAFVLLRRVIDGNPLDFYTFVAIFGYSVDTSRKSNWTHYGIDSFIVNQAISHFLGVTYDV